MFVLRPDWQTKLARHRGDGPDDDAPPKDASAVQRLAWHLRKARRTVDPTDALLGWNVVVFIASSALIAAFH